VSSLFPQILVGTCKLTSCHKSAGDEFQYNNQNRDHPKTFFGKWKHNVALVFNDDHGNDCLGAIIEKEDYHSDDYAFYAADNLLIDKTVPGKFSALRCSWFRLIRCQPAIPMEMRTLHRNLLRLVGLMIFAGVNLLRSQTIPLTDLYYYFWIIHSDPFLNFNDKKFGDSFHFHYSLCSFQGSNVSIPLSFVTAVYSRTSTNFIFLSVCFFD